jgi:hypothetical protein
VAHFAELDETNTVLRVIVVHNDITYLDDVEDEQRGIDFLNDLYPDSGEWKQCSYNHNMRGVHASTGGSYDPDGDLFRHPKPEGRSSWVHNATTNQWEAPTAAPDGGYGDASSGYLWNEDDQTWDIPPQPLPSFTFNTDNPIHSWQNPIPYPGVVTEDGPQAPVYDWDEDTTSWVEVD